LRAHVRSSAMRGLVVVLILAGCSSRPTSLGPREPEPSERGPLALTYLGVAGWQIESGPTIVLADPYFSRPDLEQPLVPDAAAIAARAPKRADLIVIGHSHADHLLDAPEIAKRTGAQLLGSRTTALVARASGVADDHIITVKGGEDFAMAGFSVRAIPSLHAALGAKHVFGGELATAPTMPMKFGDYQEGGTYAYLLRIAGHRVLVFSTANFIERELEGLAPDIAIIAPGLREEIHDYTCRLLRVLGYPRLVYATHFDTWTAPPVDEPPSEDLTKFVAEVARCSPATKLVIPKHFERMVVR
jgi:L-ascorbate metabolism protein UlaG (beta-lactamase superfamily)